MRSLQLGSIASCSQTLSVFVLIAATWGSACGDTKVNADGECITSQRRCQGQQVQICADGAWIDGTACAPLGQVCVDGGCAMDPDGDFPDGIPDTEQQDLSDPDTADQTDSPSDEPTETTDDEGEQGCVCAQANRCCDGCVAINEGLACSDGNVCTQTDVCRAGRCEGGTPIACEVNAACLESGACDPATGQCTRVTKPNDAPCDDGDPATQGERCRQGMCVPPQCDCAGINACCDGCHTINEGGTCDDGNGCSTGDRCRQGACIPDDFVRCTAENSCRERGLCDPATGQCTSPYAPNDTPCDDGRADTCNDRCLNGVCGGLRRECESGPCCDGCRYKSEGTLCGTETRYNCANADTCGDTKTHVFREVRCSGRSALCDGRTSSWSQGAPQPCGPREMCFPISETTAECRADSRCDHITPDEDLVDPDVVDPDLSDPDLADPDDRPSDIDPGDPGDDMPIDIPSDQDQAGRWVPLEGHPDVIVDMYTERFWMRDTGGPMAYNMSQRDAESFCASRSLGGVTGWRLPTVQELRSIIAGCPGREEGGACGVVAPNCLWWECRNSGVCGACQPERGPSEGGCYWWPGVWRGSCGWTWTGSPFQDLTGNYWPINFATGEIGTMDTEIMFSPAVVRCVWTGGAP